MAAELKRLSAVVTESLENAGSANSRPRRILLPQLDREKDGPGTIYWTVDAYKPIRRPGGKAKLENDEADLELDDQPGSSKKRSRSSNGGTSATSCYMEDKDGKPIPEVQRDAARQKARSFWEQLLKKNMAPSISSHAGLDIMEEFIWIMENEYPWLRLCENHWKSVQLWRNHYSPWYGNAVARLEKEAKAAARKASWITSVWYLYSNYMPT